MTKNQIEYNKLLETQRNNQAVERQTAIRDENTNRLGIANLAETARHNEQVELQARDNLAETYRNNVAQLAELQRSHLANEGIANFREETSRMATRETMRHNETVEEETARHNAALEQLQLYGADVNLQGSQIASAAHTAAAGISAAASQYASDNALLAKQLQLDLDKYGIQTNAILRSSELTEARRAAQARERETARANVANEALRAGSLLETARHDIVAETQNAFKNILTARTANRDLDIKQQTANTQAKAVASQVKLNTSSAVKNYITSVTSVAGLVKGK